MGTDTRRAVLRWGRTRDVWASEAHVRHVAETHRRDCNNEEPHGMGHAAVVLREGDAEALGRARNQSDVLEPTVLDDHRDATMPPADGLHCLPP